MGIPDSLIDDKIMLGPFRLSILTICVSFTNKNRSSLICIVHITGVDDDKPK